MARGYGGRGREWHPEFLAYMELIVDHPNYAGLPCTRDPENKIDWTIPSNRKRGSKNWDGNQQRRTWWAAKAQSIGIDLTGPWLSTVAREIHPFGKKPCQTCGRWMSIHYVYPTRSTAKRLQKAAPTVVLPDWQDRLSIQEVADLLEAELGVKQTVEVLRECFPAIQGGHESLASALGALATQYTRANSRLLSPGAMSNAPDRLDGFHTYNLCCRSGQDIGRARENLNRYVVDRRAYEQWAEGDWNTADVLMKSAGRGICGNTNCPSGGTIVQLTADHVGPISLGFMHSPNFEALCGPCNSAKNNRMSLADVQRLIRLEKTAPVISWHAKHLWETCSPEVDSESDALLMSRLLRINQDAYIRFLAEGALAEQPEALLQFLDVSWAQWRVTLEDLDCQHLTFKRAIRTARQSGYATSRAARIIRVAYEALFEYASSPKRNLHRVQSPEVTKRHDDYVRALQDTPPNAPQDLVDLGKAIRNAQDASSGPVLENLLRNHISTVQDEVRREYRSVGEALESLMLEHQRELVLRFESKDHRVS